MFAQLTWTSSKVVRTVAIVARVGALSASMYSMGYYCGVTDHINKPEKLEQMLLKDILLQNSAKDVLPSTSKETRRVTIVVQRLLPAAQTYCKLRIDNAKATFSKDFSETYTAARASGVPPGSEKIASLQNIDELIETLAAMQGAWKVVLLDSPLPNAFVSDTFPHRVFVCRGLLDECQPNDDELALVLGHELSHLIHRHSSKNVLNSALMNSAQLVLIALLDPFGIASIVFELLGYIASSSMAASFSRQHETEADSTGLQITALACYDTKRGANIFAKLAKFPGSRQATQWNDTHPASPERFVALQAASENINWRHHLHCYPLLRNLERIGIKLY